MSITIAKMLKDLRARKGITQEQFASYLGVTYQAVSKWERGEGYPDITLLPVIANFYEISTDELLGVDLTQKEAEIEAVVSDCIRYYAQGHLDDARRVLEDGLQQFPNAHRLLLELIQLKYETPYATREEKRRVITASITVLERILDESTVPSIRNLATILLIRHYTYMNRRKDALVLAEGQATMNASSTVLLCDLTEGEDRLRHIQQAVRFTLEELNGLLSRLGDYNEDNGYTLEEKIAIRELSIRINEAILGDEVHAGFGWNCWKRCELIARGHAMLGDKETALHWLQKSAAIAVAHDALNSSYVYSTLPLKGCSFDVTKAPRNYACTEHDLFVERLKSNDVYAALASDPRYQQLL